MENFKVGDSVEVLTDIYTGIKHGDIIVIAHFLNKNCYKIQTSEDIGSRGWINSKHCKLSRVVIKEW